MVLRHSSGKSTVPELVLIKLGKAVTYMHTTNYSQTLELSLNEEKTFFLFSFSFSSMEADTTSQTGAFTTDTW
jgi:hypothetical protein